MLLFYYYFESVVIQYHEIAYYILEYYKSFHKY